MMFRIQKLLVSEYIDFEEIVLVENPFTEVNMEGFGVCQVHMALTGTKLIIASDIFDVAQTETLSNVNYTIQDPETESMELISLVPLEYLEFDFFRDGNRQIMKVTLPDFRAVLFEFGGHIFRNLYWNTWRDRIASLRLSNPVYYSIANVSPYCSSDIILDTQIIKAQIHRQPSYSSQEFYDKNNLLSYQKYNYHQGWSFEKTPLKDFICPFKPIHKKVKEIAESFLHTQSESILSMEKIEKAKEELENERNVIKSMSNIYECNNYEW